MADAGLTVAVTGPTGTFGLALMPLLQEDDRGSQQVERGLRARGGLLLQQVLQFRLLLGVEEAVRRPGCPVLTDADRIVAMESVCRNRRRIHKSLDPDVGRRAEKRSGFPRR